MPNHDLSTVADERGEGGGAASTAYAPSSRENRAPRAVLAGDPPSLSTSWEHSPSENRTTTPPFSNRQRQANLRVVTLPQTEHTRRPPLTTLVALQEWEGYITRIGAEDFTARLIDLTADASYEEEEATIPRTEISEDDAERMREGSIFRWVIGYERSPSGTKKRVSQVVFRNLPVVSRSDVRRGKEWAHARLRSFDS